MFQSGMGQTYKTSWYLNSNTWFCYTWVWSATDENNKGQMKLRKINSQNKWAEQPIKAAQNINTCKHQLWKISSLQSKTEQISNKLQQ
jgi:hypothetical protein